MCRTSISRNHTTAMHTGAVANIYSFGSCIYAMTWRAVHSPPHSLLHASHDVDNYSTWATPLPGLLAFALYLSMFSLDKYGAPVYYPPDVVLSGLPPPDPPAHRQPTGMARPHGTGRGADLPPSYRTPPPPPLPGPTFHYRVAGHLPTALYDRKEEWANATYLPSHTVYAYHLPSVRPWPTFALLGARRGSAYALPTTSTAISSRGQHSASRLS